MLRIGMDRRTKLAFMLFFLMIIGPIASISPLSSTHGGDDVIDFGIEQKQLLEELVHVNSVDSDNSYSIWQWAIKAGGSSRSSGYGIAIDSTGNAYVTGEIEGTATFGSTSLTSDGGSDIFVAKLSSSGTWQWAVKAGGRGVEIGIGIVVDSNDNIYVNGHFEGTATFGPSSLTSDGGFDVFVAKINPSGTWQWAIKAGGGQSGSGDDGDRSYEITIDSIGDAYVIGRFEGTATFGSSSLTSDGAASDVFIAKINSSGSWQWAIRAGGSYDDFGVGIIVDVNDYVYAAGHFQGTATFGSSSLTSKGGADVFVAKISSSGTWQWAVKAGGSAGIGQQTSGEATTGITIDSTGNVYVIGYFWDSASFGYSSLTSEGSWDGFVAKISSSGTWQWAINTGGSSDHDYSYGITVDSSGNTYVTGMFKSTVSFGSSSLTSGGDYDIFLAMLNEDLDGDGVLTWPPPWMDTDYCPNGVSGWTSTPTTDMDGDGCQDISEDDDDDGDGWPDSTEVDCGSDPKDSFNQPLDTDGDLICDVYDNDDDGDGVSDSDDAFPKDASKQTAAGTDKESGFSLMTIAIIVIFVSFGIAVAATLVLRMRSNNEEECQLSDEMSMPPLIQKQEVTSATPSVIDIATSHLPSVAYYSDLLAQGYSEDQAVKWTQVHYPDFQPLQQDR